ncbi:MAG: hypothetical protein PHU23_05345 [Dehalococcoidales bacterium]|nr:hypothetical protein [Dehalococcoidales bacterium]
MLNNEVKTTNSSVYHQQLKHLVLYVILLAVISTAIHEAAHVVMALIKGVPFEELQLGFWGLNPSITLPGWVTEDVKTPMFYAGGLITGLILFLVYLFYWVPKYLEIKSYLCWIMGLATAVFVGEQLITGYLEGQYHSAYILGASSLMSLTNILTCGCMIAMVFFHLVLCPRAKMREKKDVAT